MMNMAWYVYALLSALGVSSTTLLKKRDLKRLHSFEYIILLAFLNLIFVSLLLPWVDFRLSVFVLLAIYFASLLGTFALWFSTKSLKYLKVSQVAPLSSLHVLFTLFFAVLFLGEYLSLPQALGVFLLLYSLWFLSQVDHLEDVLSHFFRVDSERGSGRVSLYRFMAVGAMAFLGLAAILDKWVLMHLDVISFIFWIHLGVCINHLLVYLLVYRRLDYLREAARGVNYNILLVSGITLLSRLLYAQALILAPVSLVAPIRRLSSLFTTFLGGLFFREEGLLLRVMVALLMILGVFLIVI